MEVKFRQGRGGRWRWHLYSGDVWQAMSRSYEGYWETVNHAKFHFGHAVELILSSGNPDDDWPQYAGARDWAD